MNSNPIDFWNPEASRGNMGRLKNFTEKFSIFSEIWYFMKYRKKWWLGPIFIILLLLSLLIILTEGSALAPFIYTIF